MPAPWFVVVLRICSSWRCVLPIVISEVPASVSVLLRFRTKDVSGWCICCKAALMKGCSWYWCIAGPNGICCDIKADLLWSEWADGFRPDVSRCKNAICCGDSNGRWFTKRASAAGLFSCKYLANISSPLDISPVSVTEAMSAGTCTTWKLWITNYYDKQTIYRTLRSILRL